MDRSIDATHQIDSVVPRADTKYTLLLAGVLAVAAVWKLILLASNAFPFNADEAVVGLMARHILDGERPVFFYGQAYMGSLDAFLVAAGFALFGAQVWVIRLVQAGLYLATLTTSYSLGKRLIGSEKGALLATLLLAIPVVNVTLYTTVSLGGYGEALLLGNLILLATFRIATILKNKDTHFRAVVLYSGWFGVLTGLGLWTLGITLLYAIPAGAFILIKGWKNRLTKGSRRIGLGIVSILFGVLIGASPLWLYAARHGFQALFAELGGSAVAVEGGSLLARAGQHLINLVLLGLPALFGLRPPWEVRWLALPLAPLVFGFWVVVWVYIARMVGRRRDGAGNWWVLICMNGLLVAAFLLTPFGADPSGRYFLPLAVPMALGAAAFLIDLGHAHPRIAWILAGLVIAFNIVGTVQSALRNPPGITTQFGPETHLDHRYDAALIDFLKENGETLGYSNYWVSYPLAFLSNESLIFTPSLPYHTDLRYTPRDDRYAPYDQTVAASNRVAYITTGQAALETALLDGFTRLGISWREMRIGDYRVFYDLSRKVTPQEMGLYGDK